MLEQGASSFKSSSDLTSPAAFRRQGVQGWIRDSLRTVRWPWIVNIVLLITGLGLGQGAIFVVQSVLVAAGEYKLLASFGTHYSFAMLAISLVDAGASTTVARAIARLSGQATEHALRIFWETTTIRFLLALLICVAAAVFELAFTPDDFSRWYVPLAFPGLMFWAFNAVGVLDGLRLSGVSGITSSIAYVVNAIGLASAIHKSPEMAGAILGGAFSIGYLLTLVAQWSALAWNGWYPRYRNVTYAGLRVAFKDSLAMLFQLGPGQLIWRVQILLSATYLGAETTALFVYVRQIMTGLMQIIGFVLRIEFPGLVERFASLGRLSIRDILEAQKITCYCGLILTAAAGAVSSVAVMIPGFSLHKAAVLMLAFTPTLLAVSLSLVLNQVLAAMGAYSMIAKALAISSIIGTIVSFVLIAALHVYALVLGELMFNLFGSYFVYRYIRFRS